ncbi:RNB domain-containing protein [Entamoeba marina]
MISYPSQVYGNASDNSFLVSVFSYSNYYWANFIQFYSHNVMIDSNGLKLIEGSYVIVSITNTSKWYVYDRFNNSLSLYKNFRIPIEYFYPTQIMSPIDYLSNKVEYQNQYSLIPVCVVTNLTKNLPMSVPSSPLTRSQSFGSSDSLTSSHEFNTENQLNPIQVVDLKSLKKKNKKNRKKPKTPIFGAIPDIKPKPEHKDYTDLTIFTVDDSQAKMLDDAISIEKEGDIIIFGIHCIDYGDQTLFSHLNTEGRQNKIQIGLGLDRKRPAFSIFVSYNSRSHEYVYTSYGKTYILIKAQLTFDDYNDIIKRKNIDQTNSILNGKLSKETTAEEIHNCCLLFSELMLHLNEKEDADVIYVLGDYISRLMANFLISTYGEKYALYTIKNGSNVSTFRSPLRKPRDVLVLKQIEAARKGFGIEEMTFFVLNVPPNEFNNAVRSYEIANESKR